MKKIIALALGMIMTTSVITPCLASQQVAAEEKTAAMGERELWHEVINSLDESEYGGAYVKDGELHIKPKNNEQVQSILFDLSPDTRMSSNIILDKEAEYTLDELNEAMDKSESVWDELELNYVALSEANNGLRVGAPEWSDDKKQIFIDTVGVDNIIFELADVTEEETTTEMKYNEARVTNDPIIGTPVSNINRVEDKIMTIGACVLGNNRFKGFITTAHSAKIGDKLVTIDTATNRKNVGKVIKSVLDGKSGLDVALIEQEDVPMYNELPSGKRIMIGERPVEGDDVIIAGGNGGEKDATITSINCKKAWDAPSYGDVQTYYNLIMMDFVGGDRTIGGDSGAPILRDVDRKWYELVGIYKGSSNLRGIKASDSDRDGLKYAYGSRWDLIESHFNVRTY